MKYVYLAGPVTDCSKYEANGWRHNVAAELAAYGITAISPLRCEPPMADDKYGPSADPKFGTARAIGSKNLFDVRNCDMMLAYLPLPPEGRHQSWGTIVELAWAFALGKPAIVVSDDPAVQAHPIIDACAGWMLGTLSEGVDTLVGLLSGYVKGGRNV